MGIRFKKGLRDVEYSNGMNKISSSDELQPSIGGIMGKVILIISFWLEKWPAHS